MNKIIEKLIQDLKLAESNDKRQEINIIKQKLVEATFTEAAEEVEELLSKEKKPKKEKQSKMEDWYDKHPRWCCLGIIIFFILIVTIPWILPLIIVFFVYRILCNYENKQDKILKELKKQNKKL